MLTVLIATYNGAKNWPGVLNAYCRLEAPEGGWKLVIVDNGSTDGTAEIIQSFRRRLPLTYLLEPAPGKSAALNTGLASVEGDLVVLTDDDVLPRSDWLKEFRRAADSQPSFSFFGGQVIPRWEVQPEPWILAWPLSRLAFAFSDPSAEEGPARPACSASPAEGLARRGSVFGANMAIRTRIFEAGYRFNTAIGPRCDSYAMGEDTELITRLEQAGFRSWYCKKAVAEHLVSRSRMSREWIAGKALRFGRGQYRLRIRTGQASPRTDSGFAKEMARIVEQLARRGLEAGWARLFGGEARTTKKYWHLNFWVGQWIEARHMHKAGPHADLTDVEDPRDAKANRRAEGGGRAGAVRGK